MTRESIEQFELADELEKLVVGQRVVGATANTLTLSNGAKITIDGSSDCCAYGAASIESLADGESVITSVQFVDGEQRETAHVFLLTDSGPAVRIDQEWDSSNGYYFYGLYLTVEGVDDE